MTLSLQSSPGWPTAKYGKMVDGHIDFSGHFDGWIFYPDGPSTMHISFSGASPFVFCPNSAAPNTEHIDFSSQSRFVLNTTAQTTHYDFSTDAGFVFYADGSGATPDAPAEPPVVDASDWWLEVDTSEVECGTDAFANVWPDKIRAGSYAVIRPAHITIPLPTSDDNRNDCVKIAIDLSVGNPSAPGYPLEVRTFNSGYALEGNYIHIFAQFNGGSTNGSGGYGQEDAIWSGRLDRFARASVETNGACSFTATGSVSFTIADHIAPSVVLPLSSSVVGAANAIQEAFSGDGKAYAVAVSEYRQQGLYPYQWADGVYNVTDVSAYVEVSVLACFTGGRFRFKVGGKDEYSAWLDLLSCTFDEVQAAISAMPTVVARGGLALRAIGHAARFVGQDEPADFGTICNTTHTGTNEINFTF